MFMNMLQLLFGWMPTAVAVLFIGALCVFMVVGVIKLIGKILDAIPFV